MKGGWDATEVDIDPRYEATHVVDLNDWERPYGWVLFDVIWASPDCTQYSRARTTATTPRYLQKADRLVDKVS